MSKAKETLDIGTGSVFEGKTRRVINKDGSFNVLRRKSKLTHASAFQRLINMKRGKFIGLIILTYLGLNFFFAVIYYLMGPEQINGTNPEQHYFLQSFYFSIQTFTTLGYGHLSPAGTAASVISSFEAMLGLFAFALFTGVMYGRFSRPTAKLLFSENAIIAPYKAAPRSLMFKVANARRGVLMDAEASVYLLYTDNTPEGIKRRYYNLDLEISKITFFSLTWTIVHPIDENSPLYDFTASDFEDKDVEILILIKAFDETFSQMVYGRNSYDGEEVVWGAKFVPSFHTTADGEVELDVDTLSDFDQVELS